MKLNKANLSNIGQRIRNPSGVLIIGLGFFASYFLLALTANIDLVSSYVLELNLGVLYSLVPSLVLGYHSATAPSVVLITVITSLLVGVNLALLSQVMSAEGATGSLTGTVLSMTVSGCAACTTGVISIAGASIGVSFLPFKGLEINILGAALLGYTTLYISEKDRQKICEI